jgi:membrane associated rhomboid family serine protease
MNAQMQGQKTLEDIYRRQGYLATQGKIFSQLIQQEPKEYSALLRDLMIQSEMGNRKAQMTLGQLAIRSTHFEKKIGRVPAGGDRVAQRHWWDGYQEATRAISSHPSFVLGLARGHTGWTHWFTYQFMHSGFIHIIGNMFFLLLFGSVLEPLIGGLAIFCLYLLSGASGAALFLGLAAETTAPLIGASGAVSGLMACFALIYWNRPVRFFYWLLPIRSYMGFIFLPAWVVLIMWVLSDIAGYWSGLAEIGGVAYTAHLGGTITGLAVGWLIKSHHRFSEKSLVAR